MRRSMLTACLCAALLWSGQVLAQEEAEEAPAEEPTAEEPTAEEPTADVSDHEEPAADVSDHSEPAADDVGSLGWEQAWDAGFALYREGNYGAAIPYLERALEAEPNDPTVRAYVSECYRRTGDAARAQEHAAMATQARERETEEETVAVEVTDYHREEREPYQTPFLQPRRQGRHFGIGMALGGNALSVGMYVHYEPIPYVDLQGGLGLGDVHTFFWWFQASVLPLDIPISPSVGAGVLGTMGLDFHYRAYVPRGAVDYYMNRLSPYVHVGVLLVTRLGFTAAFDLNGVFTGDPSFPMAPWMGVRLGFMF